MTDISAADCTYSVVADVKGVHGIRCLLCHRTTFIKEYVASLFCPWCGHSHNEPLGFTEFIEFVTKSLGFNL